MPEFASLDVRGCGGDLGGVRLALHEHRGAYMADAQGSGGRACKQRKYETPSEHSASAPRKGLFYAKKLSPEVDNMLRGSEIAASTFLCWWKGTSVSKDFWIETTEELIRIHSTLKHGILPSYPSKNAFYNSLEMSLRKSAFLVMACRTSNTPHVDGEWSPAKPLCLGLAEAVSRRVRVNSKPDETPSHMSRPALWSLNKQELVVELSSLNTQRGPPDGERATGCSAGRKPKGLAKMTLEQLLEEATRCGLIIPERPTKGVIPERHGGCLRTLPWMGV